MQNALARAGSPAWAASRSRAEPRWPRARVLRARGPRRLGPPPAFGSRARAGGPSGVGRAERMDFSFLVTLLMLL
jgi:hypothetical protein